MRNKQKSRNAEEQKSRSAGEQKNLTVLWSYGLTVFFLSLLAPTTILAQQPENNQYYHRQWGLENTGNGACQYPGIDINVKPAWKIARGAGITVAVLDGGVMLNHPDLAGNLLPGFDATDGKHPGTNGDCDGIDDHGTKVAGVIGAIDNNIGIIGVAPDCKMIPIRVHYYEKKQKWDEPGEGWPGGGHSGDLYSLTVKDEWLAAGITYAWKNGADVINCSWGDRLEGDDYYPLTSSAIDSAITYGRNGKGCVIVASAGNYHGTLSRFVWWPADRPDVMAVGAILDNGNRLREGSKNAGSCFHGDLVDVVAPGFDILSTSISKEYPYDWFHETSSACPFVAGVAALVLSANPCLTQEEVREIISLSCRKLKDVYFDGKLWYNYIYYFSQMHKFGTWNDEIGHGLVDAYKAVMYAKAKEQLPTFYISGEKMPNPQNVILKIENEDYWLGEWIYGAPSNPVKDGTYTATRHEVRATIPYNLALTPTVQGVANGLSPATNTNNGKYYMGIENVTETGATLKTYVYEVISGNPNYYNKTWIPVHPDDVRFHVAVIPDNLQHKLYLQNKEEASTINYNVIADIAAGKNVEPNATVGNYTINSRGKLSLRAGESILLADGFTATAGSYFHAFIEPFFTCIYAATLTNAENGDEQFSVIQDYNVEKHDLDEVIPVKEPYLKLYPNPSSGDVSIEYNTNKSESVEITLRDSFGKPLYILKNRTPHDSGVYKITLTGVELPTGIYFCTLKTENHQKTEKLMIVR